MNGQHMFTEDGPEGVDQRTSHEAPVVSSGSVELQLFDSLIHHLVEKGLFTRNDALSVIQTVIEVHQGMLAEKQASDNRLRALERLYGSFKLLPKGASLAPGGDADNVRELRPPLHGSQPKFPKGS